MTSVQRHVQHAQATSRDVTQAELVRPSTPSFRILNTFAVNPSPTLLVEEELDDTFEDVISPAKLRNLSGCPHLEQVLTLDLTVDTTERSLGSLGALLPNLRELRLSGSLITSVRDLGTTLRCLRVLWMSRCGLQDLDGISSIGPIRELYLSYNEISDISPLSMVDTLELVDVESNDVKTLEQVEFLSMCPNLTALNIEGNPVTCMMSEGEQREKVHKLIPQLEYLDDMPVKGGCKELSTASHKLLGNTGYLSSEMRLVSSSLKESISEVHNRPNTAGSSRVDYVLSPSPAPTSRVEYVLSPSPAPSVAADCGSSGLTQGSAHCGPASKLKSKLTKTVKDNLYSEMTEQTPPPTLVGAWSDEPDDMIREWHESRDWLTRELTQDNINEKNNAREKRADYEAALRETSRPSSSRLSNISNEVLHNLEKEKPRDSEKSRNPAKSHDRTASRVPEKVDESRMPLYDESVEVMKRSVSKPRDKSVDRSRNKSVDRRRDKSVDRRRDKSVDKSRDRSREPFDLSKPLITKDGSIESTNNRSSGKAWAYKSNSSTTEYIKRRTAERPTKNSDPGLGSKLCVPVRAVYRPADVTNSPISELRTLPTPPGGGGSGRPRRAPACPGVPRRPRVSIEEQVAQQATVDVLFSERMPKPGLSRHNNAAPSF